MEKELLLLSLFSLSLFIAALSNPGSPHFSGYKLKISPTSFANKLMVCWGLKGNIYFLISKNAEGCF
ncbi:MAG: hypothetical protein MR013_00735 [Prevotella sp.]|nr:hypothetical protein [Prevotella sp.]